MALSGISAPDNDTIAMLEDVVVAGGAPPAHEKKIGRPAAGGI